MAHCSGDGRLAGRPAARGEFGGHLCPIPRSFACCVKWLTQNWTIPGYGEHEPSKRGPIMVANKLAALLLATAALGCRDEGKQIVIVHLMHMRADALNSFG